MNIHDMQYLVKATITNMVTMLNFEDTLDKSFH